MAKPGWNCAFGIFFYLLSEQALVILQAIELLDRQDILTVCYNSAIKGFPFRMHEAGEKDKYFTSDFFFFLS